MMNPIKKYMNKRRNKAILATFRMEREMIRKAMERVAAASTEVLVIEAAEILALMPPAQFKWRVDIVGADEIYMAINTLNYRALVNGLGHLVEEDEFLVAMCLIDRCEEFGDYNTMVQAFKLFEYVVRHTKVSNPTINYSRRYLNRVRDHLMDLGLY